jgi:hypothetical protein
VKSLNDFRLLRSSWTSEGFEGELFADYGFEQQVELLVKTKQHIVENTDLL